VKVMESHGLLIQRASYNHPGHRSHNMTFELMIRELNIHTKVG
jgi:hypothetical protein